MTTVALVVIGVVLLAAILLAPEHAHRHQARPPGRSPRLAAGSGWRGTTADRPSHAPDAQTSRSSHAGPLGSRTTRPRVASRLRDVAPSAPPGFERPPAVAHLRDNREAAWPGPVAGEVRPGRRGGVIAVAATGLVTAIGVWFLAGPGAGLVLLAGSGGVLLSRRLVGRRVAARLRAERASAAPVVIDLLSACLLAGLNPYRSLVRVAERSPGALRAELARAAAELDMGRTPAAALRAVGERTSLDELRAAAAALEAADRWGAPPAEALAARAEALRSRARLRAEAEAGRAAVRLAFPLVFCFLPSFVLLVVIPTMAGALRVLAP